MLSLKEVEFQFWEQFSHFEDVNHNEFIEGDSNQMLRGSSFKQKRLNHSDMWLYGQCQDKEIFSVVTCHKCGMILKQQAFSDHLQKRHSSFSLSDDDVYSSSENLSDNVPVASVLSQNEHKAKRRKIDNHTKNDEMHYEPNIESLSLGTCPSKIFQQERQFLKPKPYKPHRKVIKCREGDSGNQQIKLKLRKSDHGMWAVAGK